MNKLNSQSGLPVLLVALLCLCACNDSSPKKAEGAQESSPKDSVLGKVIVVEPDQSEVKENFQIKIRKLLKEHNFSELNSISKSVVVNKAEFEDGTKQVTSFFAGLSEPVYGSDELIWVEVKTNLEAWQKMAVELTRQFR